MELTKISVDQINTMLKQDNLLNFNRKIQRKHVEKLVKSIDTCGLLRLPVFGDISAFDSRGLVILDGQHLCAAISQVALKPEFKVNCIVKKYNNKAEVIKDMSMLNMTQKTWNDEDFLNAWYHFGSDNDNFEQYEVLMSIHKLYPQVPLNALIEAYTPNKKAFRSGELIFRDSDFSIEIVKICKMLKEDFFKGSMIMAGLVRWCNNRKFVLRKDLDFIKLKARLSHAMRTSKNQDQYLSRENFYAFIEKEYTRR